MNQARRFLLSVILGDHDDYCVTRKNYNIWHFLGLQPYEDHKTLYGYNDFLIHYLFLAIPTFLKNTVFLIPQLVFFSLGKLTTQIGYQFASAATACFDALNTSSPLRSDNRFLNALSFFFWQTTVLISLMITSSLMLAFYGLRLALYAWTPILSPLKSYREAQKRHFILGLLSASFTILIYCCLIAIPAIGLPIITGIVGSAVANTVLSFITPSIVLALKVCLGAVSGYFAALILQDIFVERPKHAPLLSTEIANDSEQPAPEEKMRTDEDASINKTTLSLLTLNVGFIPLLGNSKDLHEDAIRAEQIAQQILDSKKDVILLQEMFHPQFNRIVRNKLRAAGYLCINDPGFGNTSGLMVCVKKGSSPALKVLEKKHFTFSYELFSTLEEHIATKGIIAVKLQINETQYVTVVVIHGVTRIRDPLVRSEIMERITPYLTDWAAESPNDQLTYAGTILGGDFNVAHRQQEKKGAWTQDDSVVTTTSSLPEKKQPSAEQLPFFANLKKHHRAYQVVSENASIMGSSSLKKTTITQMQSRQTIDNWQTAKNQEKESIVDAFWIIPGKKNSQITASSKICGPVLSSRNDSTEKLGVLSDHFEVEMNIEIATCTR